MKNIDKKETDEINKKNPQVVILEIGGITLIAKWQKLIYGEALIIGKVKIAEYFTEFQKGYSVVSTMSLKITHTNLLTPKEGKEKCLLIAKGFLKDLQGI